MKGVYCRRLQAIFVVGLLSVGACQREPPKKKEPPPIVAAPSGSALDRMQFFAARRVSLESATAAMKRRDVERLKQLNVWVRNRATVPILEPDDLTSLELAIGCLEHVAPPTDAIAKLDALKSGQLRKEARDVCVGSATE
jgi:hypothetical protein